MTIAEQSLELLAQVTAGLPGGGERRGGQDEMTVTVADALASNGHAVVQAGTGTGKSLAYLVPIALSGQKVVVATATKALQDQLADKDLPFLSSQLDEPIDFSVLKGRSNYLCLQRLNEAESEPGLGLDLDDAALDDETLENLRLFAETSKSGDRSELADVSDRVWQQVSVSRQECPGANRCPEGESCFAEKAWRRAAAADVLIVNLYLYAIDVAIQCILPDHDMVIIDEAHQLEDIVANATGRYLSPARLVTAAASSRAVIVDSEAPGEVEKAATMLKNRLETLVGSRLPKGPPDELGRTLDLVSGRVADLLNDLRAVPSDAPSDVLNRTIRARQSISSVLDDISYLRWAVDDEVMWVDGPTHNPSLRSTPLAIDQILAENLWSQRGAVLTSATMPLNATSQFGLPSSTVEVDVGSPFDYESNALLYCAADLPDPRNQQHRESQLQEIESLVSAAGGRTLALFTSWGAMQQAAAHIESRVPWTVLQQGEGSKAQLLKSFIENEETCLFATMSFWQGIDAVGPTCNLVIIDRLPFPRPDEPLLQARRERAGADAFRVVDLPRAAIMLAQGAGRLIRSATDRGVVAVLDPRLATSRSYRWALLGALPPMRRTKDRSKAETLLRELRRNQ
ncbi:MAG: ATP-dependent DNA helicase [Acidimicrobiaceae bacterium]|nr:ATP-dependent DNA helicase [Acidimicrobiaceae bacterium]MXW61894.1 ATP-dependent DNA helicase [Acidimicrobiaceae bacterium]MYC43811.1 ATP-dependent DNA helicase [Acidimicrobiaceae bacterium]